MGIEIRELIIKTEIQTDNLYRQSVQMDREQLRQLKKELMKSTHQLIEQRLKRNSFNR